MPAFVSEPKNISYRKAKFFNLSIRFLKRLIIVSDVYRLGGFDERGDFNSFGPDLAIFMIEISRFFKKRTLPRDLAVIFLTKARNI